MIAQDIAWASFRNRDHENADLEERHTLTARCAFLV